MYTAKNAETLTARLKAEGADKPEIIRQLSALCLDWPYVWASQGEMCTPKWRRNRIPYCWEQKYADRIRDNCPVLSDGVVSCAGCKWDGVRCFDCRGFTRWLLAQVSIPLYGESVTTQWETASNWAARGTIDTLPRGLVCCVFRSGHTGMYMGDNSVRHCSGTVKEDPLPGVPKWERWGIPAGLYTTDELRKAGLNVDESKNIPILRRGSQGDEVEELQALLNAKYGANLDVDSIFGAKTEAAVKAFQQAKGLTADGIVGPKTRAALGLAFSQDTNANGNVSTGETPAPRPLDAQGIWDKLMIVVNGNPYAAAGIMGNMFAESSLIANNLQNTGNKALSMTDEEYTAAVDSGAYTAEQFASDGYGYGLCQWTYSTRKAGLLQCARKCTLSIGDAGPQIVFLREELQSSFRATLEKLLAAKSVREASDAFMLGFEKPKNQSEENQARRAELGQKYFDQFADHAAGKDDGSTEDTALASMLVALPRVHLIELKACLSDALNIVNSALSGSD